MLSFTKALPLFLLVVTAVSLLIQVLDKSSKNNVSLQNSKCSNAYVRLLLYIMYLVSLFGVILAWFTLAKIQTLYVFYILTPLIPTVLLLLKWKCDKTSMSIASLMLWYIMIGIPPMPKDSLFIVEGIHMVRTIVLNGMWIPEEAHNPAYALFPTVASVQAILSLVTGTPWYNYFASAPMFIAWAVSLGVLIYLFTRTLHPDANNEKLLPLIFLALTPQLYLFGYLFSFSYQIPAMIIWLISVVFFVRYVNGSKSLRDLLLSILTLVTATLTHPSTVVALGYIFTYFFARSLSKRIRFILTNSENFNNKPIQMYLLTSSIIFVVRAVYDIWYVSYVLGYGLSGIYRLINFMIGYEEPSVVWAPSIYDVGNVLFYQAYAWTLVAGLALGKALYDLASRRSISLNEFSSIFTAVFFTSLGFIWGALARGVTSQLYRSTYVSFVFFIPVAVALGSKLKSSTARYILLLMIVVASITILTDPEVSLVGRLLSRGIPPSIMDIQSSSSDIIQASIIIDRVGDPYFLNHIGLYSRIQLEYERLTAYGKMIKQVYNPMADAIYKVLYIRGFTKKDFPIYMPYIVTQTQLNASKFNIVYNSFKYYCLI